MDQKISLALIFGVLGLLSCGKLEPTSSSTTDGPDAHVEDSGISHDVPPGADSGNHEAAGAPPDSGTPQDSTVWIDLNLDEVRGSFGDLFRSVNLDAGRQMTDPADYGRLMR